MPEENPLKKLRGLVATVCTTGSVTSQFSDCLSNMRDAMSRRGFVNIEWLTIPAKLVEVGRESAVRHMLQPSPGEKPYDWLLQIDADATFPVNTLDKLLMDVYVNFPQYDAIGAYAQLRGAPYRPVIDTGTGTWEYVFPNQGVIEVMRTGGHCLLTKLSCFQKVPDPRFRTMVHKHPARALADVDTFLRTKTHGNNPLTAHPEWETIVAEARSAGPVPFSEIGEDSAFCDRLTAAGGRIAVDTDLVTGHVTQKVLGPQDLIEWIDKFRKNERAILGVLS